MNVAYFTTVKVMDKPDFNYFSNYGIQQFHNY
jgi:hypothetical protein